MNNVGDIDYVKMTIADLDEVEDLLATEFYPREIKRKCFGDDGKSSRNGAQSWNVRQCLESGISVGVRERSADSLVGVMTCRLTLRDEVTQEPSYCSEIERKVIEFLKRANSLYDPFEDPTVHSVLDLDCLCVHRDFCRRGIARTLVEMSMDVASAKGYQLARSEVSSPYSEKIFRALGFQIVAEMDFPKEEMLYDPSLMDYTSEKIMIKRM